MRNRRLALAAALGVVCTAAVLAGKLAAQPDSEATSATPAAAPARVPPFRAQPGRFFLTDAEIARIRRTVRRSPWAATAWSRTKALADSALGTTPTPAPADADYSESGRDTANTCTGAPSGWYCLLYMRGIHDGQSTLALAEAYAVTGDAKYAAKAKEFLLAWARTYTRPSPTLGHDIADTAGFMLKGFLAYDLVRGAFDAQQRAELQRWAALFVPNAQRRADVQVDFPGIPAQTFNGDTSNWQSWGNSAAYSRALAVAAAAVVGGPALTAALAWNWSHRTQGGRANGWTDLIDGEIVDGTGGQTFEGRGRNDLGYALLGSNALLVIADIAKHAGYRRNLFTYKTPRGNSLLLPYRYYAGYLSGKVPWPKDDGAYAKQTDVAARNRASLEIGAENAPAAWRRSLKAVVSTGGPGTRGANFDPYIWLYNALLASQ